MKLQIGFSPCPNDTFIFDALIHQKIDTGGIEFEAVLEDVQTLNEWAMDGRLPLSKISYGVLPLLLDQYILLDSGGALGKGVGPLLIAKKQIPPEAIDQCRIAIPGRHTTAHLLFSLAFPKAEKKEFMIFSDIEDAVLQEKTEAGVIIHENRFTYQEKGLYKLMDLGEFWEKKTGAPIPLGGIVMKKDLEPELIATTNRLIRKSLEYAYAHHYKELAPYVHQHAQEMSTTVMRQHIDLYVNDFSLSLGENGKKAVGVLLEIAGSSADTDFVFADSLSG